MYKKIISFLFIIILSSCSAKKTDEDGLLKKKRFEPNVEKRQEQAIGKGITVFGKNSKNNSGLITDNVIWQATLESLSFAPLNIASYSGGIIATDWYSFGDDQAKISVKIYSEKPSPSAIDITTFIKKCNKDMKCKVSNGSDELNKKIKSSILDKIRDIEINKVTKN